MFAHIHMRAVCNRVEMEGTNRRSQEGKQTKRDVYYFKDYMYAGTQAVLSYVLTCHAYIQPHAFHVLSLYA